MHCDIVAFNHIDNFVIADKLRNVIKSFFAREIITDFIQILSYCLNRNHIGIEKNVVLWYIIYKKICEAKNESVDLYRTRKI